MTVAAAEGEREVPIAVVGDNAPTAGLINPPLRALVVETSTLPDRRTKFFEAGVAFDDAAGFLVKLPSSVSLSADAHQFLLIGYEIAFELLV